MSGNIKTLEKQAFGERLKYALESKQYQVSPTFLARQFNLRYDGQQVSVQTANNWIHGKAIPSQEKLLLLSTWLNINPHWLRFGETTIDANPQIEINDQDILFLEKFNALTKNQKEIIFQLMNELSN